MSPDQRARVVPTLFIVAGVVFAYSSARGDLAPYAVAFGVAVGLAVAAYGVWRLLEVRRAQRGDVDPGDDDAPPPGP